MWTSTFLPPPPNGHKEVMNMGMRIHTHDGYIWTWVHSYMGLSWHGILVHMHKCNELEQHITPYILDLLDVNIEVWFCLWNNRITWKSVVGPFMSLRRCKMKGVWSWADHIQAIHSQSPILRSMKLQGRPTKTTSKRWNFGRWKINVCKMKGLIVYFIGWDPNVCKSNRLHVDILRLFLY